MIQEQNSATILDEIIGVVDARWLLVNKRMSGCGRLVKEIGYTRQARNCRESSVSNAVPDINCLGHKSMCTLQDLVHAMF